MRLFRNLFRMLGNNRGELDLGDKKSFTPEEVKELVTKQMEGLMNQSQVDDAIKARIEREGKKYGDYDTLVQFKKDHETKSAETEKARLESEGKYEEAQKINISKITELSGTITERDNTIQSMTIGNALTNEIVNQNGFLEESLALLRQTAKLSETGVVTISGLDANGVAKDFPLTEGIKAFFDKKPHLVKAKGTDGGGDSGGGDAGGGGDKKGAEDLTALNDLLTKQRYANDYKGAQETTDKIKKLMAEKGTPLASQVAI